MKRKKEKNVTFIMTLCYKCFKLYTTTRVKLLFFSVQIYLEHYTLM